MNSEIDKVELVNAYITNKHRNRYKVLQIKHLYQAKTGRIYVAAVVLVNPKDGNHRFIIGKYYVKEYNGSISYLKPSVERDVEIGIHWSSRDDLINLLNSTNPESIKTLYSNEVNNAVQS